MTARQALVGAPDRSCGARLATCVALAAWAWAIVAANAPVRGLDAVRERAGRADLALPDWRLFAPSPLDHDLALEYRTRDPAGRVGPWLALETARGRRWWRVVVSPGSRRAQAYKQVARHLVVEQRSPDCPEGRRLARFVRTLVEQVHPCPVGGQFGFRILRAAAHDETFVPLVVLESQWIPFDDEVLRGCQDVPVSPPGV